MSKLLLSFFLFFLTSQYAFSQTVEFRASDFISVFGSEIDLDKIDCAFDYTINESGEFELLDIDLTIGQKTYAIDEIGVDSLSGSGTVLIGALPDIGGMSGSSNDFWFFYSYTSDEVSGLRFAVQEFDDFFDANVIDRDVVFTDRIDLVLDDGDGFVLPSEGGRVNFDVNLSDYQFGEFLSQWGVLTMPNGDHFPTHKLREIQITRPDGSKSFNRIFLDIPSWFDDGEYTLTWYVVNTSTLNRENETLRFVKGNQIESVLMEASKSPYTSRIDVVNGQATAVTEHNPAE